jgi:hypothetical protein
VIVLGSYHYKYLAVTALVLCVTACENAERTTPQSVPAAVPTLVGLPVATAVSQLESAGLRVSLLTPSLEPLPEASCGSALVRSQGDPPGTELVRGSTVELTAVCAAAISPSP